MPALPVRSAALRAGVPPASAISNPREQELAARTARDMAFMRICSKLIGLNNPPPRIGIAVSVWESRNESASLESKTVHLVFYLRNIRRVYGFYCRGSARHSFGRPKLLLVVVGGLDRIGGSTRRNSRLCAPGVAAPLRNIRLNVGHRGDRASTNRGRKAAEARHSLHCARSRRRMAQSGAGGVRQAGDNFRRHRFRLDVSRLFRISCRPDPLFESLDRQFSAFENSMLHGEAGAAQIACFAFNRDFIVEVAGQQKPGALFDQRHADNAVIATHFGRR